MRRRTVPLLSAFVIVVAILGMPGRAAADILAVQSWSGGSMATALNGTVISDLTAASSLHSSQPGAKASNTTASVTVNGLLTTGKVFTSQETAAVPGGIQVTSKSTVSSVSLLGGLITFGAVASTNTAKVVNGVFSYSTSTTLTTVGISGADIPVDIPPNYVVTIPNVATVILNGQWPYLDQGKGVWVNAAGVYVSLLKPYNSFDAGVQIWLTPTFTGVTSVPTGTPIGGWAFGTAANANIEGILKVVSGPTAFQSMPPGGTAGETVTNSTAAVNLPNLGTVGAVRTTATGTVSEAVSDSRMTAAVTNINLLGGLIKADAITSEARVIKPASGTPTITARNTFANLVIAGNSIGVNPAPNSQITIANVGVVTLNGQELGSNLAGASGLSIVLSTANYGLPAGATIYVSFARVWFTE